MSKRDPDPRHARRRLAAGLLVAGAAALALLVLVRAHGRPQGGHGPAAAPEADGVAAVGGDDTRGISDETVAPSAGIDGVVVDARGDAVDGALITLARARARGVASAGAEPQAQDVLAPAGAAVTSHGGFFRLDQLPPGEYAVAAMRDGWAPAHRTGIVVQARERARVELKLREPGLVLDGRVLDEGGGGIAGALVTAAARATSEARVPVLMSVVAGADGRYRMSLGTGHYLLRGQAVGYVVAHDEILMAHSMVHDLRLVPGARVAGLVVDRASRAVVAGAEVVLTSASSAVYSAPRRVAADDRGHFELVDVAPGDYELSAHRDALVAGAKIVSVTAAESADGLVLELGRGATIRGRIANAAGEPVGGALVSATRDQPPFGPAGDARSSADGSYVLAGVLPGGYDIAARAEGYRTGHLPAALTVTSSDVGKVDLALAAAARVAGVVRSSEGRPVEGAFVRATVQSGGSSSTDLASTDGEGHFVFDRLPPGTLEVTARHPEHGLKHVGPEQLGTREPMTLVLVLEPGGSIAGTVRGDDGSPAADVRVTALTSDARVGHEAQVASAADGRYRLTGLPVGRVEVVVHRGPYPPIAGAGSDADAGHAKHRQAVVLASGEEKSGVDLVVPSDAGTIRGVAVSAGGEPVVGATITAAAEANGQALRAGGRGSTGYTKLDGHFTIGGLSAGTYTLWAEHPDFASVERRGVLVSGEGGAVTVRFRPEAVVSGAVVTSDGGPVAHYTLTVLPSKGVSPLRVDDPSGTFELRRLGEGRHELVAVSTTTRATGKQVIDLAPGERKADVRIELASAARVTGHVVAQDSRQPIAGARVAAIGATSRLTTDSGADGAFTLDGVPRGEKVRLYASADFDRYVPESKEVEVARGDGEAIDVGAIALLAGNYRDRMMGDRAGIGASIEIENGRAVVLNVAPGGPAARAGVRDGDVLLSIEGRPIAGLGSGALRYLTLGPAATPIELTLATPGAGGDPHAVRMLRQEP